MPYFCLRAPSSTASRAALALLPILAPAAYAIYWNWTIRQSCTSVTGRLPPSRSASDDGRSADRLVSHDNIPRPPQSLPAEVLEGGDDWIVCFERVVSKPVPRSLIELAAHDDAPAEETPDTEQPSKLLTNYSRAAQLAFSWTPQAFLIRSLLREQDCRDSSSKQHIERLSFRAGDLVNGIYKVSHNEQDATAGVERSELIIHVPPSYTGPPARGLILSEMQTTANAVVFANETWLWRRRDEKPTLLESPFGRWFHGLLAGWLITRGIAGLSRRSACKALDAAPLEEKTA